MKGLQLLGLGDLQKEIDRTSQELIEAEQPAEMAAGQPIRDTWVSLVPVKDGHYRDSLIVAWVPKVGAVVGTRWLPQVPRNEQPFLYSKTLEFGRDRIPAQPSARPAAAQARQEALDAGKAELQTVVKGRKPRKRRPTK